MESQMMYFPHQVVYVPAVDPVMQARLLEAEKKVKQRQEAQRRWREKNPDYLKTYRAKKKLEKLLTPSQPIFEILPPTINYE